jgi:hypothetical protein
VPKRNIETWLLNLTGNSVDEVTDYKSKLHDWPAMTKEAATALFESVKTTAAPGLVPSLQLGITELTHL